MITVTVLVENTARGAQVLGEHGLSFWIETPTDRVLFDTGQGMALLHNAEVRGVDLSRANAIVLSHGHFDHVGGLEAALRIAPEAALFLHPCALEKKFSASNPALGARCISTEFVEHAMFADTGRRVIKSTKPVEVVPGIWTTGEVPRTNNFEDTGGPFYLDAQLSRPDPLLDDQALFFRSRDGVVVVLGCAHAGVVNTLSWVAELTGHRPIHTVIGGMHLENASERRMAATVAELKRLGVERLGPMHCTGWKAFSRFCRDLPDKVFGCAVGTRLEFPPER